MPARKLVLVIACGVALGGLMLATLTALIMFLIGLLGIGFAGNGQLLFAVIVVSITFLAIRYTATTPGGKSRPEPRKPFPVDTHPATRPVMKPKAKEPKEEPLPRAVSMSYTEPATPSQPSAASTPTPKHSRARRQR